MNKVLAFLDTPGAVRLLSIDYSKAFDTLPHKTILSSLASFKAPKELVGWIASYLSSREHVVKVGMSRSQPYVATSGVPQGAVLSPILFAVAVDSLRPLFQNSILIKFADDMCLLHFVREEDDDHLSEELDNIVAWSSTHGLAFNSTKTKLLNFQTKRSLSLPPLKDPLSNTFIQLATSIKLLGLTIDSNMTWCAHTQEVLGKIRKRVYMLYSLRQVKAPKKVMCNVYCTLIRSVASYAYPAWCNIKKCRFIQLAKFKERLCQMVDLPRCL